MQLDDSLFNSTPKFKSKPLNPGVKCMLGKFKQSMRLKILVKNEYTFDHFK